MLFITPGFMLARGFICPRKTTGYIWFIPTSIYWAKNVNNTGKPIETTLYVQNKKTRLAGTHNSPQQRSLGSWYKSSNSILRKLGKVTNYFGNTVRKQNYVQEEMKGRLNSQMFGIPKLFENVTSLNNPFTQ